MAKIKKDDTVLVIAGKDRGVTGKVLSVETASLLKVLTAKSVTPKNQLEIAASKLAESSLLKHQFIFQMSWSLMAMARQLVLAFARMTKARMFAFHVAPERTSNVNSVRRTS
jgi:hypothetical protein